jgi:hypothetical protein
LARPGMTSTESSVGNTTLEHVSIPTERNML